MEGVLNHEYSHALANWIDHKMSIEHQERLNLIVGEQQLSLVKAFGLIPKKDGEQWCYLLGENLQEGIAGFGDTPFKAMLDFNKNFNRP